MDQLLHYLSLFALGSIFSVLGLALGAFYSYPIIRGLIHVDKEANEELLNGRRGETISTRGGRAVKRTRLGKAQSGDWKWCILCRVLDLFEADHCVKDFEKVYGVNADPSA